LEPLRNIQAVTFDVGGTLIDPFPSVGHVYAEVAAKHGLRELDPEKLTRQFGQAWRSKTGFDYTRGAWAELVAKTFGDWLETGQRVSFFDDLYERFAQPDVWRVYDDVLPTVEMLIERGLELGIISNWDERLRPLLERLKLDRHFRVIIISQEIGFHKPSPVIFEEAARKFACPPNCVLHIGDGEAEDFEGARSAGLQALLLSRRQTASGADQLGTLAELTHLLK